MPSGSQLRLVFSPQGALKPSDQGTALRGPQPTSLGVSRVQEAGRQLPPCEAECSGEGTWALVAGSAGCGVGAGSLGES